MLTLLCDLQLPQKASQSREEARMDNLCPLLAMLLLGVQNPRAPMEKPQPSGGGNGALPVGLVPGLLQLLLWLLVGSA